MMLCGRVTSQKGFQVLSLLAHPLHPFYIHPIMKSTFSLLLSSILLSSSLTLAAPTQDAQLVFGSTKSSTRDPDFVDILDSQSFKNKLEELLHDAESVSSNLVSESYNKAADLSNEAEVEALILAASLEDKAMNILPVPQNSQSGQNKLKFPSKNDVSFSDTPIWGAFKSMNIMDAPTPPGGGWVWSSCGQSSDAVQVQDIRVSPDPPRPGQNLTVHAKGIVNSKIEVSSERWE